MGGCVSAQIAIDEFPEKIPVEAELISRQASTTGGLTHASGWVTAGEKEKTGESRGRSSEVDGTPPTRILQSRSQLSNGSTRSSATTPRVEDDHQRMLKQSRRSSAAVSATYGDPIKEDRVDEEKRSYDPRHTHVIRSIRIDLDQQSDFVVSFSTRVNKFFIYVLLHDQTDLSFRECQAISEVLRIVLRGENMTEDDFFEKSQALGRLHGTVNTSLMEGTYLMALRPCKGERRISTGEDIIERTGFLIKDNDAILYFRTRNSKNFTFWHHLPTYTTKLFMMDCLCLKELFSIAEPGDRMDEIKFKHHAFKLREKYNFVSYHCGDDGRQIVRLTPTRVKNNNPVDVVLESAHRQYQDMIASTGKSPNKENEKTYKGLTLHRLVKDSGQAAIWEGQDAKGDRVAVKIFRNATNDHSEWKSELKILLKLPRHANVIEVKDFHLEPQTCVVTRFLEGGDLYEFIKRQGSPLSLQRTHRLSVGILRGVKHLHDNKVIHRDLKSPNVMLDTNCNPVIIDLGLGSVNESVQAQISRASRTPCLTLTRRTNGARGTPLWMPPEMISNFEFSEKTDIFSFGIILWEMLSGETPYSDQVSLGTADQVFAFIQRGGRPTIQESWHRGYVEMIRACWAQEPRSRPTASELLRWLDRADSEGSIPIAPPQEDGDEDLRNEGISPPYVSWEQFVVLCGRRIPDRTRVITIFDSMCIRVDNQDVIPYGDFLRFWRSDTIIPIVRENSARPSLFNEAVDAPSTTFDMGNSWRPENRTVNEQRPEIETQVLMSVRSLVLPQTT
uniref:Protein kinase domain-containing protein n=1 Tax=Compsopogon caeruleus TaxID=31354 RepID=A0A7S1T6F8_9RHOD